MDRSNGNSLFSPSRMVSSKLNRHLHRYVRLRGVRWTRYAKPSKLREEFEELLEAIQDFEANPSEKKLRHIQEETADVFFCVLGTSEKYKFDLSDAVELKILKDRGRNMRKRVPA